MLSHSLVSDSLQPHELYSLPGSTAHRFFQEEYWSGVPFPTLGNLPNPGIKPPSPVSPTLAGRFFTTSTTWEVLLCRNVILIVTFIVKYMTQFPHSQSLPSGSFHKPLIIIHERAERMKITIIEN